VTRPTERCRRERGKPEEHGARDQTRRSAQAPGVVEVRPPVRPTS